MSLLVRATTRILLGAVYGLLGLEVASPLLVLMVILIVLLPVIVWRLKASGLALVVLIVAFVLGFAIPWVIFLVSMNNTCYPPSCIWAGPEATVYYGIAELLPPAILVGTVVAVRGIRARRFTGRS